MFKKFNMAFESLSYFFYNEVGLKVIFIIYTLEFKKLKSNNLFYEGIILNALRNIISKKKLSINR